MLKLWVAQDTRLQHELGFYEEHFSRPRAASILFTPQPGKSLLTVEAFDEVRATAALAIPATHAFPHPPVGVPQTLLSADLPRVAFAACTDPRHP